MNACICAFTNYFENGKYQSRDPGRNLINNPIGNKKQLKILNVYEVEKIIFNSLILINHNGQNG